MSGYKAQLALPCRALMRVAYLHDTRLPKVALLLIRTAVFAVPLFLPVLGMFAPFPLLSRRARLGQDSQAVVASCHHAPLQLGEYHLAGDPVLAFYARGRRKGAVALNQLVLGNPGQHLKVVDVLGILCQQLLLGLEKRNECVCGRKVFGGGQNVFCDRVEYPKTVRVDDGGRAVRGSLTSGRR